jgi:ABC-type amino acid transport substrate-binding protein
MIDGDGRQAIRTAAKDLTGKVVAVQTGTSYLDERAKARGR